MATDTLYRELYALFDDVTPLSVDCGQLCGGVCCRGGGEPAGMRLFPGEEKFQPLLSRDVADPYYCGNYDQTWADIHEGCRRILEELS